MKIKVKEKDNSEEKIYKNIYEYAKMSLEFEEKREQSLISQSNRMLTAFSITTGVLLIIHERVQNASSISIPFINSITIICMILFVTSMILALLVSWRYKYKSLPSPETMMNHILSNKECFITSEQRNKSFTETIDSVWKSKNTLNNKRAKLIIASMSIYFSSVGVALISTIIVLISKIL